MSSESTQNTLIIFDQIYQSLLRIERALSVKTPTVEPKTNFDAIVCTDRKSKDDFVTLWTLQGMEGRSYCFWFRVWSMAPRDQREENPRRIRRTYVEVLKNTKRI